MKHTLKFLTRILLTAFLCSALAGCGKKEEDSVPVFETSYMEEIRSLGELATLECYYHNVAKLEKEAGTGITHIFEKDRKYWIEYVGIAKVGIDMEKTEITVEGTKIRITLPDAEVLAITQDEESIKNAIIYSSPDGWNKNPITAEEQSAAIRDAQETMRASVSANKALLRNARELAKETIATYVDKVGEAAGVQYTILWVDPVTGKETTE